MNMQIEWFGESGAAERNTPSGSEFYVTGFRDGFCTMLDLTEDFGLIPKQQVEAMRGHLLAELHRRAQNKTSN